MTNVGFDEVLRVLKSNDRWTSAVDEDEQAQAIACAVIETYGELAPHEWKEFRRKGQIRRDHCAYQAALAALRMARATLEGK